MARARFFQAAALMLLPALALASSLQDAQSATAAVALPAVEAIRAALPELRTAPEPATHPDAVDLIVRWEVSGRSGYERRWTGVYYPGGASGPTWGIGYDGGHQTRARIRADWQGHPALSRLESTAGVTGDRAQQEIGTWRGIVTPFGTALRVLTNVSLPAYRAQTRRAFGHGFEQLPPRAAGALISLVYNRGSVMTGNARREMRVIRDECIPAGDTACIARQLRAMCRLWEGRPNGEGLCRRRDAEAVLSMQSGGR